MQTIDFCFFPIADGDFVLDLGCGEGRHIIHAYLTANAICVGVDLNLQDLKTTRTRFLPFKREADASFYLQQVNALRLPFADASFDKIICSEVLEHIEDYEQVLAEIYRLLKPGGQLAISVPRYWPEKICWWLSEAYHQVEGGHLRIFNARQLQQQVESLGFNFYKRHWAHALHVPYWWLQCLFWQSRERSVLISLYHKLLVWDLIKKPFITTWIEKLFNPLMGKSVVLYFTKK
jgi:SAM-dependent methyltransferase